MPLSPAPEDFPLPQSRRDGPGPEAASPRSPEVGFYCDGCDRYSTWTPPFAKGDDRCRHCGRRNAPAAAADLTGNGAASLARCAHCANPELYSRKDVPQQIGCAVVLAGIILATVAYVLWDFPGAFVVFASVALLDFLIYRQLSQVVVCYRCHAEFRRFPENPDHGPFDMHRAEEYEADTRG